MSTDEYVPIHCPNCAQRLAISVRFQGQAITCPACKKEFPFSGFTALDLGRARAAKLGLRFMSVEDVRIGAALLRMVPEDIAHKELILPVAVEGETLTVAVSEAHLEGAVERLRFILNRPVVLALASDDALRTAIERNYPRAAAALAPAAPAAPAARPAAERTIDFVEMQAAATMKPEAPPKPETASATSADTAVAQSLQRMIGEAFRMGATQILILPVEQRVKVAYRIHDVVCLRDDLPADLHHSVLVRLMTMVNLHGLMKVSLGGKERRLQTAFRSTGGGVSALIEIPHDASPTALCKAQAAKLGYKFVDLDDREIAPAVLRLLPEALAREHQILPVGLDDGTLMIAFHDVRTLDQLDKLRFVLNRPIGVLMASEGSLLAALDRYYGHPDAELSDLLLWELAQTTPAAPASLTSAERLFNRLDAESDTLAKATLDHLRMLYRLPAFALFDKLRITAPLCHREPGSGRLEVIFPQAHLLPHLPDEARQYLDDKVWALRETIIARLEDLLEKEPLVQGVAMSYAQYVAGCRLVEGQPAWFDPAVARDTWINFLYAFALHAFPSIESNGAMVNLVTQHLAELTAKLAGLLDDTNMVVDPQTAREWLVRLAHQTSPDEPFEPDAPRIARLVDLLVAEALHMRASRIVISPERERIEVAYRIQCLDVAHDDLPPALLRPVLDRLARLAVAPEKLTTAVGLGRRAVRIVFRLTSQGVAALIDIGPDSVAAERAKQLAFERGLELADLEDAYVPGSLLAMVPKGVAWRQTVLPLALQGNAVTLALSEPPERRRADELRLIFGRPIQVVLAPADEILAAIYRHYMPAAAKSVSATASALLREDLSRPAAAEAPAEPTVSRRPQRGKRSGVGS